MIMPNDKENLRKVITTFAEYIKQNNLLGYTDINKDCEDIIKSFLNKINNIRLKNYNSIEGKCNVKGIDLIDEENKIIVQVTSNSRREKILGNYDDIKKDENFKQYSLIFFLLVNQYSVPKKIKELIKSKELEILDLKKFYEKVVECDDENLVSNIISKLREIVNTDDVGKPLKMDKAIRGKNYSQFLKKNKINSEEEIHSMVTDINELITQLENDLTKTLREFIYYCIYIGELTNTVFYGKKYVFDIRKLYAHYSEQSIERNLGAISNHIITDINDCYPNEVALHFLNYTNDYDILVYVLNFFNDYSDKKVRFGMIYKLLVNLQFDMLD